MQIACYAVCGVAHATMLLRRRKRRRNLDSSNAVDTKWQHFGPFTLLSCFVGVFGALATAARIVGFDSMYRTKQLDRLNITAPADFQQRENNRSLWFRGDASFLVLMPVEFCFVTVVYILVLLRMLRFALIVSPNARFWMLAARIYLGVVVAASSIGIVLGITASVSCIQAADFFSEAAKAAAANDDAVTRSFMAKGFERRGNAFTIAVLQQLCEALVVLSSIVAFGLAGWKSREITLSALRILLVARRKLSVPVQIEKELTVKCAPDNSKSGSEVPRASSDQDRLFADAISRGNMLRIKVTVTFAFLCITTTIRVVHSVMFTVAHSSSDHQNPCSGSNLCHPCRNAFFNMYGWFLLTPELWSSIHFVSCPLALLVALWGMSDVETIDEMSSPFAKLRRRFQRLRQGV